MGRIERWEHDKKLERTIQIGEYIPCPICKKLDGLSTWEGERYLKCRHCGALYQKKQYYRRKK